MLCKSTLARCDVFCIIDMSQVFRTGDLVLLDGANGLLVRIEEAKDQQNYAVPEPSTTATRFR